MEHSLTEKRFFVKGVFKKIAFNVPVLINVPNIHVNHHNKDIHKKYGTLLLICVLIVLKDNSSMKKLCNVMYKVLALLEHLNLLKIIK